MKKLLIILSILFIGITSYAQTTTSPSGNTVYKLYSTFNKDTLGYLKTNFETNKAFYIGKPLSTLLGDLELPVLSSTPSFHLYDPVNNLSLYFIPTNEKWNRMNKKGKFVYISVTLSQPIPAADIYALIKQVKVAYPSYSSFQLCDWETLQQSFYAPRIIQDIQVYQIDYSQP